MLSYKEALLILTGASAYATTWLLLSGVPLSIALFFLFVAFCIFHGFARAQMTAQPFVIHAVGTEAVTPSGLVSLGMTFSWAGDLHTVVTASEINSLKLANAGNVRGRPLFWAIAISIIIGLAGLVSMVVWMGYTYEGINLDRWFYNGLGEIIHCDTAHKIANPTHPLRDWSSIGSRELFSLIGAGVMGVLMWARHHILWWHIHYIDFPIGATLTIVFTWFSTFIGWVLKATILKYGGVSLCRKLRPFFLGLILGHVFVSGFWVVFDFVTGETGNRIPIF